MNRMHSFEAARHLIFLGAVSSAVLACHEASIHLARRYPHLFSRLHDAFRHLPPALRVREASFRRGLIGGVLIGLAAAIAALA